jgi:hypothetical protein
MTRSSCIDSSCPRRANLAHRLLLPDLVRNEHAALLREPHDYDRLHRRDDLFDEGVATVFGIKHGEAELQAFCFDSDRFTADQARAWLRERGLAARRFRASGLGKDAAP